MVASEDEQERINESTRLIKRLDSEQVRNLLIYLHNVIYIDKDCKN